MRSRSLRAGVRFCAALELGLAAFLVFAAGHALIHLRYLHHLPMTRSVLLVSALTVVALIPAGLLFLTRTGKT